MGKNILITGGAGFIGSHLVNHLTKSYPEHKFFVVDSLTYASNYLNIDGMSDICYLSTIDNLKFYKYDIYSDLDKLDKLFKNNNITDVIHLAAESHVDNSIENSIDFINTNIIGTVNLLNLAKKYWKNDGNYENRFHHVSTDEVYGDLELSEPSFTESTPYSPNNPYSSSKASSDHFVRSFGRTYNIPFSISNCSNNFGPHQHEEKLIPKVIKCLINRDKIPVYGSGENIRDWLWVGDHVNAIEKIFFSDYAINKTYNIGGKNELTNIYLIKYLINLYDTFFNKTGYGSDKLITFVEDRKGHDKRYAINPTLIKNELNWEEGKVFSIGMKETIEWYIKFYKDENKRNVSNSIKT